MRFIFLLLISFSSFGQATFHSLISDPLPNSILVIGSETITYNKDDYKFSPNAPSNDLYQQSIVYDSGNSYILGVLGLEDWYDRPMLIPYYDNLGFDRPVPVNRGITNSDGHARPGGYMIGDTLINVIEHPHNTSLWILRAQKANDVYSFTRKPFTNVIGSSQSYPQIHYLGNEINSDSAYFVLGQMNDSYPGGNWGDETFRVWTADREFAEGGGSADDRYVSTPNQSAQYASGWRYFIINFRPSERWKQRYLIKTKDFKCFYNWTESFSVCDTLSDAVLSNFLVFSPGAGITDNAYQTVALVDTQENFYTVGYSNDSADFCLIYQMAGKSTINIKPLGISGYAYGAGLGITTDGFPQAQLGAVDAIIAKDSSDISIFVRRRNSPSDSIRFYQYRSFNQGNSWILVGDVFNDVDPNVNFYKMRGVSNIADIPFNKNFPLFASELVPTVEESANIYVKKAAFNQLQNETDSLYSLTPYTFSEYNALTIRSFYTDDALLSRSGANVTALIDQSPSGLNTSVPVSSPQFVSVGGTGGDYVTFNGAGQFMILTTFADVAALEQGTVVAVARKTTTTNARAMFLCGADIGVANKKIGFGINTSSLNNSVFSVYNPSGISSANNFHTYGSDTVDTDWHIYVWQFSDGVCQQQWIDGVKQIYNWQMTSGNVDLYNLSGAFFSQVANIDRISIGRLSTNVAEDFDFDLKHIAIFNTPVTFEQVRKLMPYLGNRFNIDIDDSQIRK